MPFNKAKTKEKKKRKQQTHLSQVKQLRIDNIGKKT